MSSPCDMRVILAEKEGIIFKGKRGENNHGHLQLQGFKEDIYSTKLLERNIFLCKHFVNSFVCFLKYYVI
jgi:hypothetical protein